MLRGAYSGANGRERGPQQVQGHLLASKQRGSTPELNVYRLLVYRGAGINRGVNLMLMVVETHTCPGAPGTS
jgi:hypothetical protein